MSPLQCPQDRRNHHFSFRKEIINQIFSQNSFDQQFAQNTRELTEESVKKITKIENDAKLVKDSITQLCMILRNKLNGPPLLCFLNKQSQSANTKSTKPPNKALFPTTKSKQE